MKHEDLNLSSRQSHKEPGTATKPWKPSTTSGGWRQRQVKPKNPLIIRQTETVSISFTERNPVSREQGREQQRRTRHTYLNIYISYTYTYHIHMHIIYTYTYTYTLHTHPNMLASCKGCSGGTWVYTSGYLNTCRKNSATTHEGKVRVCCWVRT